MKYFVPFAPPLRLCVKMILLLSLSHNSANASFNEVLRALCASLRLCVKTMPLLSPYSSQLLSLRPPEPGLSFSGIASPSPSHLPAGRRESPFQSMRETRVKPGETVLKELSVSLSSSISAVSPNEIGTVSTAGWIVQPKSSARLMPIFLISR